MIILKNKKTIEDCPNGCDSISYLHDNQEDKTCCKCRVMWNRIDGKIINNKNLHCFQCEIEMPAVEEKGYLYCSNCGLMHITDYGTY